MSYQIGQRVRLLKDIYEHTDDYAPGGYLALAGEELIVRRFTPGKCFPVSVSHEHITNNSFGVELDEIEAVSSASTQEVAKND